MFRMPRVTSPIRRNDRLRLLLEPLEDRTVLATINGTAFYDTVTPNGVQDEGEGPAAGIVVTLSDESGATWMSETTDAYGWFAFTGPLLGNYQVWITPVA